MKLYPIGYTRQVPLSVCHVAFWQREPGREIPVSSTRPPIYLLTSIDYSRGTTNGKSSMPWPDMEPLFVRRESPRAITPRGSSTPDTHRTWHP
jgi:hypothetical protein